MDLSHVIFNILESAFLNGLRKSLKDQVVRCRPVNLADIVEIAKLIESQERNNATYPVRHQPRISLPPAQTLTAVRPYVPSKDTNRASGSGTATQNHNLCRHCGERWYPGHRCKQQQRLKSLEVTEEEEEESSLIEELNEPLTEEEAEPEEGFKVMSLGSMTEETKEQSMRMRGYIGNARVVILIDSGATCKLVKNL